jgi:M6 family metalloprotease-like protein
MRNIILIVIMSAVLATLAANFVQDRPVTIIQPDGSKLEAYVTGDEFYHRVHDAAGYTILQHPKTGAAVYAIPDGKSVQASEYRVGSSDPAALGLTPNLRKHFAAPPQKLVDRQRSLSLGQRANPVGTFNNIVVFVRFADETGFMLTDTYADYNSMYNSMAQSSLRDYYDEVSSGQLTIDSHLFPPAGAGGEIVSLQVTHNRGYYQPYVEDVNDEGYTSDGIGTSRHFDLISEIVDLADDVIPTGVDYDNDDNSMIDSFCIIFSGTDDTWGDVLWPMSWWPGPSFGTINGINVYLMLQTFEGSGSPTVTCHEMGHNLGCPDFYHYTDVEPWASLRPVGGWDLMASGGTVHWLTYLKWKYGTWFSTIPEIFPNPTPTTYTLQAIDQNPYACYKIASTDPDQFYMLEYRRSEGLYEGGVPNEGLLVYRIITSHDGETLEGNAEGPPDEAYIYRPGGDVDSQGSLVDAVFSLDSGRTELSNYTDPKPWIWADTLSTPDGNLVVTDVGALGGTSISFKISTTAPNTWTGNVSANWNTAGNWSYGAVPGGYDWVIIPADTPNDPVVSSANAYCSTLEIEPGSNVSIGDFPLRVYDSLTSGGVIFMTGTGVLRVEGDITWEENAMVSISAASTAGIYCYGDMTFAEGSRVNMTEGFVTFGGNTGDSNIFNYSTLSRFHDVNLMKTSGYSVNFDDSSTYDFLISGNLHSHPQNILHCTYNGMVKIYGDLVNEVDTNPGSIQLDSGTVVLMGTARQNIMLGNSHDYLNNLSVYNQYEVLLQNNLRIKGNFTHQGGIFYAVDHTIRIGGDWINSSGPAFFSEGTSTVRFDGSGHQYCDFPEDFHILELNKTGGALRLNGAGAYLACDIFDWISGTVEVLVGTFLADDLADTGIYGNWWLTNGNIILHNADSSINLNGTINMTGGSFTVYGGSTASSWAQSANATITMSGGVLDFADNGVVINTGTGYILSEYITGGTIRVAKNFLSYNTAFNPAGLTLEMKGTTDASLLVPNGLTFQSLLIDKGARSSGQVLMNSTDGGTRSNTVTAMSNIYVADDFVINSGIYDPGSFVTEAGNDVIINGQLQMNNSASTIISGDSFTWNPGSVCSATAGTIECYGNWYAYEGASVALAEVTNTYLKSYYGASILIEPSDFQFGNLTISGTEEQPRFWFDPNCGAGFQINGSLIVNAENHLDFNNLPMNVGIGGNLSQAGELSVDIANLSMTGRPTFNGSSIVNISGGSLTWSSSVIPTSTSLNGTLNLSAGIFGGIHHTLTIPAGSVNNISGGTIQCTTMNATSANTFQPSGGVVEFTTFSGHSYPNLIVSNGNWLYNMKLNTTTGINLGSDLLLLGYLDLFDGNLDVTAANYQITLGGNWMNTQGEAYFDEQGGRVVFNGENDQYIVGSEVFNVIENANTGGAIRINNTAYSIFCSIYDTNAGYEQVEVPAGSFTANDLLDAGVPGSWSVGDHGVVNLYNSDGPVDILRSINLNGGTMNIYGGTGPSGWGTSGNTFITISAGTLDIKNQGISIDTAYTLTENITGGKIRCTGNFSCNNANFTPAGGILEMYGTANSTLSMTAGQLWQLTISKSLSPTNVVTATSSLNIRGQFSLSAGAFVAGGNISIGGHWSNRVGPVAFNEGTYLVDFNGNTEQIIYYDEAFYTLRISNTSSRVLLNDNKVLTAAYYLYVYGNLKLDPGSSVLIGSGRYLTVFNGGRLETLGILASPNTISTVSGNMYFTINSGGTLAAEYTLFDHTSANSFNIADGAIVDPTYSLNYCTFQNGVSGGVILRINNSQDITITGASFPISQSGYNVGKTADQGSVTFVNATGVFAGENFDYDNYNRINWTTGIAGITSINISYADGNAVLTWTSEPAHDNFIIYRSASPDGTFTQVGTSTTYTWSEPALGERWFYRVTAYQP